MRLEVEFCLNAPVTYQAVLDVPLMEKDPDDPEWREEPDYARAELVEVTSATTELYCDLSMAADEELEDLNEAIRDAFERRGKKEAA